MAAFREWEAFKGERFADLRGIRQPALVVNGVHDEMIAVANSYWLADNLPNAVLLAYPDAGHGSLFQYPDSFTTQSSLGRIGAAVSDPRREPSGVTAAVAEAEIATIHAHKARAHAINESMEKAWP